MSIQQYIQTKAASQLSFTSVQAGLLQRKCACGQHTVAGNECAECRQQRAGMIQRTAISPASVGAVPLVVHEVLSSPGQPLDAGTKAFIEPRFGHDFSQVRVHTDAKSAESAKSVNALAYTVGRDVVFGMGQYEPGKSEGRRLLAHELTHVVQQDSLTTIPGMNLTISSTDSFLEQEANSAAETMTPQIGIGEQLLTTINQQVATGPTLQRQEQAGIRFPTLEVAALRSSGAFAVGHSPLTSAERADAASIFGSSIDLSRVRIVYSPVISAPTTLGNDIRVPPNYAIPRRVLIHELTHIWQFQTKGSAYISDSVFHQSSAVVSSLLTTGRIDRGGAYRYQIVPGKSFHDYTAEQQASIVEDYFAYQSLRGDPDYVRLIDEVRAASPISVSLEFFEEQAAGLAPRGRELPPIPGTEQPREGGGNIPQIEFRF